MSGGLAWAIVEPSTNSTIEWTIDCGCTVTSIRSYGTSNSRCASITSRPLLTRVAEFVVTTSPMSQVGCASASAGVTSGERRAAAPAERAPGCGEHQPADLAVVARPQRLRDGRVLGVHRHDLTRFRGARDELAADDEALLVGEGEGRPDLERGEGRREADRAGDPVQHDVGHRLAHERDALVDAERGARRRRSPPPARRASRGRFRPPARPARTGRDSPRSPRAPAPRWIRWIRARGRGAWRSA